MLGLEEQRLKEVKGYWTAKEIAQQPKVWQETFETIKEKGEHIRTFLQDIDVQQLRIIVTGAGSSAFVGEAVAPILTKELGQIVEPIATTDIVASPDQYLVKHIPTLLVSFARSGNSPESVAAVKLADTMVDNIYHLVITCNQEGKLAKDMTHLPNAYVHLLSDETNDRGFAMTSSFTSMLLSCVTILLMVKQKEDIVLTKELVDNTSQFIDAETERIHHLATQQFERIVYLGSGELRGIARESALKVLELTAGAVSAHYDTPLGFRHGPKSIINDETIIVLYVSNNEYTRKYELDLLRELAIQRKGEKVIVVGPHLIEEEKGLGDIAFTYNDVGGITTILHSILFGQLLSYFKSYELGITPDNPCPTGEVNRVVQGVIIHDYE